MTDTSKPNADKEHLVLLTGVRVPYTTEEYRLLPQDKKVTVHVEALAKQWREDNGMVVEQLAATIGCTRSEAEMYVIGCHINIISRCAQETASAINYLARRQVAVDEAYRRDREGKQPWE